MNSKKSIDRIIIIGFMGTGKTAFGALLARKLRLRHVDTDRWIVRRQKRSIFHIFKTKGESHFRKIESKILKEILEKKEIVLSTGGGIVLSQENRRLIKMKGFVVWLRSTRSVLLKRLTTGRGRPLMRVLDPARQVSELLTVREPLYRSLADVVVLNSQGSLESKALGLAKRLRRLREKRI